MSGTGKNIENLTFDAEFFMDEVREGFYIASMVKRYWAAQLIVLGHIDRICRKYEIPYYADNGTLLGAVRHRGYIPWDDDLDICMMRHDFVRFFKVAEKELPEGYVLMDLEHQPEYSEMIGRVCNSQAIISTEENMKKYYGCPYTVGVDIFPLDGLCDNEAEEEKRRERLKDIRTAMDLVNSGQMDKPECRRLLAHIESDNHTTLHRRRNLLRQLFLLNEKVSSMYSSETAAYVALMPFWVSDHNHKYSKELYRNRIYMNFENIRIPVPARYREVLEIEYGQYMRIRRNGGGHGYPAYGEQEEILRNNIKHNPFRYTFPHEVLMEDRKSLADRSSDILNMLQKVQGRIRGFMAEDTVAVEQLLEGCQSLAISLGNLIEEKVQGKEIIKHLEEYCELTFVCHENITDENLALVEDKLKVCDEEINQFLKNRRKEVLFLPVLKEWWPQMEPLWRELVNKGDMDVYVLPVPYFMQHPDGNNRKECKGGDELPPYVRTVTAEEYNPQLRRPDMVIVQNPYDDQSSVLGVPEMFLSRNLREITNKLVYAPGPNPEPPVSEKDKALCSIKFLAEQPAVYYSDEVWLPSEGLKCVYVDTLMQFTGKDSREYWEKRIIVQKEMYSKNKDVITSKDVRNIPKEMLFQVTLPFILEYKDKAISKLRNVFNMLGANRESVKCVFVPHESIEELRNIDIDLWNSYRDVITEYGEKGIIEIASDEENCLKTADVFYGNEGYDAYSMSEAGKPVLLMDIAVGY